MIEKNITMQEIAKHAGVSLVTVDRVLNNRANVKDSTRNKVIQAARELNYAKNSLASALRARRNPKKVAAILHANTYNLFSQAIWDGIHSALHNNSEYPINLDSFEMTAFDVNQQYEYLKKVAGSNYDGLIIRPINHQKIHKLLAYLREKGTKIIFVISDLEFDCADLYVGSNPYQAGRKAASVMGKFLACKYPDSCVAQAAATEITQNIKPRYCAILTGSSLSRSHTQKIEGIRNFFSENYTWIKLLGPFEVAKDFKLAQDILALLARDYRVDGIIYQSFIAEHITLLHRLLNKDIITCAFTSCSELSNLLTNNSICYAIDENPLEQGYQAMTKMLDLLFTNKQSFLGKSHDKKQIIIESKINCGE